MTGTRVVDSIRLAIVSAIQADEVVCYGFHVQQHIIGILPASRIWEKVAKRLMGLGLIF